VNIAHDEGDSFFDLIASSARLGAKSVDPELAPASRKIRRSDGFKSFSGHTLIIAAARRGKSIQGRESSRLAARVEVKDGVLLGGDGDSVVCGGMEVPVLECSQNFLVEL